MLAPQILWTDGFTRLVLSAFEDPAHPEKNVYYLEHRDGDRDSMGQSHWVPYPISWDVLKPILNSVLSWLPVDPKLLE
jgi:hypothetical protein